MKVLITGAQWHDNSPAIVSHGFQGLGLQTEIFYDNPPHWSLTAAKVIERTPLKKQGQRLEAFYQRETSRRFLEKIKQYQPDFIFVIAGLRFSGEAVKKIREEHKIPIANFVVDDPAFCGRTLLRDLAAYSEVFVIDKSWMPVLEFFNPGHIHYLPHAGDVLNFKPLGLAKEVDIAFGGTMALRMPNGPAGYLRAELLAALAGAGFKIRAYAGGIRETFREFPALKNIEYYDGYKSHEELNRLYNQARIVLSIHSPQLKGGVSPRVFDAALSGAFQLVEYKPDMPELFSEGVKCFKNKKELIELVRYYIEHDDERERLAKIAHQTAANCHTFTSRAQEILKIVFP